MTLHGMWKSTVGAEELAPLRRRGKQGDTTARSTALGEPSRERTALRSGRRFVGRVGRRLLRPVASLDLSVVYRLDLTRPVRPFSARIETDIRFASASDLPSIRDLNPYHSDAFLLQRFSAGHLCFVAWCNGVAAGQNWLALSPVQDDDYHAAIAADEVYCLDAFTRPEFRGKAIHTELLCRMLLHAQAAGRRTAYTRASAMNSDSWKTHMRLGWSEAGTTFFVRLKSRQKALLKGRSVYPLTLIEPTARRSNGAKVEPVRR